MPLVVCVRTIVIAWLPSCFVRGELSLINLGMGTLRSDVHTYPCGGLPLAIASPSVTGANGDSSSGILPVDLWVDRDFDLLILVPMVVGIDNCNNTMSKNCWNPAKLF